MLIMPMCHQPNELLYLMPKNRPVIRVSKCSQHTCNLKNEG
ncbi:hypothetical protein yrohd0001_36940 [Yersinia rohdei ATCC 43380]|nr:hypothetical protein yrohd0001_36940 [Yersinia rohdei ATCC 43380]